MATQNDNTILSKADLKAYHQKILPFLGGNAFLSTNNSDYYSTDEKIIGVWTDGRPIYQKTYFTGALPNNSSKEVSTGVSNIDDVISIAGYAIENSEYWYPITYANTSAYVIKTYYRKSINSIVINTYADWGSNTDSCVTLQYTKTTDSAGSALTTPGAYDINRPDLWPANKEIFFGDGLYGQRFTGTITASANNLSMLSLGSTGARQIIDCGGCWYHGSEYINLSGTNATYQNSGLVASNNALSLRTYSNQARTNAPYDIWVTYTK